MDSPKPLPVAPPFKRRWYQYSLRSLFVFTTICAIACSWFAVRRQRAERQRAAVETIRSWGWRVDYDYAVDEDGVFTEAAPPGPAWLRELLVVGFLARPVVVGTWGRRKATDADLDQLKELPQLRKVFLSDSEITDAGLDRLKELTQLKLVCLDGAKITDAGLQRLAGLKQLEDLNAENTRITGPGLDYLKGLTQLTALDLSYTKITDRGLEHLKGLPQLEVLSLYGTKITDAGLEHLKGLHQLRILGLFDTHVTDQGVMELHRALPKCGITKPNGDTIPDDFGMGGGMF